MHWLADYGLFLAKVATVVIALLVALAGIFSLARSEEEEDKGQLKIKKLNDKLKRYQNKLQRAVLGKKALKKLFKLEKKQNKPQKNDDEKKRVFVLHFDGDVRASQVQTLRDEITALLTIANHTDEVVVVLESGGGLVHSYGLAASQLLRIRERQIPLTVVIDKVAASGGYLMACVANRIVAAPFAIIGSIGVLAQIPNFNRYLKHHYIDFEQMSAGEYKRTLSLFGENTHKGRKKMQQELEDTHVLFKEFINNHRPQVDINQVATGEHWYASQAFDFKLVDKLATSDDYLLNAAEEADVFSLQIQHKKSIAEKTLHFGQAAWGRLKSLWLQEQVDQRMAKW